MEMLSSKALLAGGEGMGVSDVVTCNGEPDFTRYPMSKDEFLDDFDECKYFYMLLVL